MCCYTKKYVGDNDMDIEKPVTADVKTRRRSIRTETLTSVVLLGIGIYLIARAIFFTNNVMAFIGIALTFWGALLLYIRPNRYIRNDIFAVTTLDHIRNLNSLVTELNYRGSPRYISPGTLSGLGIALLYIPKSDQLPFPSDEQLSQQGIFIENPSGLKFTPLGVGLSKLVERKLNVNFSLVDLEYLQNNLGRGFINDLEIITTFQMAVEGSNVKVTIKDSIFNDVFIELYDANLLDVFGDVFSSAIACIFARSTRSTVFIENYTNNLAEKTIIIDYKIESRT